MTWWGNPFSVYTSKIFTLCTLNILQYYLNKAGKKELNNIYFTKHHFSSSYNFNIFLFSFNPKYILIPTFFFCPNYIDMCFIILNFQIVGIFSAIFLLISSLILLHSQNMISILLIYWDCFLWSSTWSILVSVYFKRICILGSVICRQELVQVGWQYY